MMDTLKLFLVSPNDHEHLIQVIVANTANEALRKALMDDEVAQVAKAGANFRILNVTKQLGLAGYDLFIAQNGVYH